MLENYPGFADVIQGPWLMDQMRDQAKAVGTEMIEDHISSVNLKIKTLEAIGDSGQKYTADSIIISTGAQARWLNLNQNKSLGVLVSQLVQRVMVFLKIKKLQLLVVEMLRLKKQCSLQKFASKVKLYILEEDGLRAEKMLQKN